MSGVTICHTSKYILPNIEKFVKDLNLLCVYKVLYTSQGSDIRTLWEPRSPLPIYLLLNGELSASHKLRWSSAPSCWKCTKSFSDSRSYYYGDQERITIIVNAQAENPQQTSDRFRPYAALGNIFFRAFNKKKKQVLSLPNSLVVKQITFLGVPFDSNRSWSKHVMNTCKRSVLEFM